MNKNEYRLRLLKTVKHTNINKVYKAKAIKYGKTIDLVEYDRVKLTFKQKKRFDYEKSDSGEKRKDSIYRTRNNLFQLVESNLGQYGDFIPIFATLTFKENITDLKQANIFFRAFIRKLHNFFNFRVKYVFIPEFQKRGAVHYHGIFFNLPFIELDKFQNLWGQGFTRIETPRKIKSMSRYLCKYLTKKTIDERLFGERILMTSKGLVRPDEVFGSDEVAKLLDSVKMYEVVKQIKNNNATYKKILCKKK